LPTGGTDLVSADLVVGIDGGGSKTLLAVADRSGRLLTMIRGSGVNPVDKPGWRDELTSLGAGLDIAATALAGVAAGLPVHGEVAALSEAQRQVLSRMFPGPVLAVCNDVDVAHIGAFAGGPGILILSGSGSMAWARDTKGGSYRVGGWGELIGDEGSAFWIGQKLLGLVSQTLDGRAEAPGMVAALFAHLGLDAANPQDSLTGWVAGLSHPRSAIAALAEPVAREAATGNADAIRILEAAAAELARHVTTIARLVPGDNDLAWSYAGGVFASTVLLEAVARELGRRPVAPRLPPIGGALLLAATRSGWSVDEAWIARLAGAIAAAPAARPRHTEEASSPDRK
jgi:N-acetylglucosamine kinase-like BadF-type ATPase